MTEVEARATMKKKNLFQHDSRTFEEAMNGEIDLILEFAKGLKHQIQFRDQRMLNTLQREGASFLHLAKACMEKDRRMNSKRSPRVSTWEKSTSSAMFYRTRPAPSFTGLDETRTIY